MGAMYPKESAESIAATHGINHPADEKLLAIANNPELAATNPIFAKVQKLLAEAHKNANEGGVALAEKRGSIQANIRVMREELNHTWQRSLTGRISDMLSPKAFQTIRGSVPQGMVDHLTEQGYDLNNNVQIVTESAAKLMGGKSSSFGVTPEEKAAFLDSYFTEIAAQHGPHALDSLTHLVDGAKDIKEKVYAEHTGKESPGTNAGLGNKGTDGSTLQGVAAGRQGGTTEANQGSGEPAFNREKVKEKEDEANLIQMARTAEGKLKLGADPAALGKILGSSLYSGDAPKVITKELVQNAMDAVRESTGDKDVTVEFGGTGYPEGQDRTITVTDTGKGMTKNELETVFTDLGASGKRENEEASGGFGLAKAAPLMMSKRIEVNTVVKEGNKYYEHSFTATPEDLLGGGVDIKTREIPVKLFGLGDNPKTGTTVKTYLPSNTTMYGALNHLHQSSLSLRAPGNIKVFENGVERKAYSSSEVPAETQASTTIPGAKLDLYVSKGNKDTPTYKWGGISIEVHNNGIFQFMDSIEAPEGIRGIPSRIAIDVRANVPEGDPNYPFQANRESLRTEAKDKVKDFVKNEVIDSAVKRHQKLVSDLYHDLPMLENGYVPFFDAGGRLTPEELKEIQSDPAMNQIGDEIFDLTARARTILDDNGEIQSNLSGIGKKVKRVGLVFSPEIHGVHITDPMDKSHATILINPFDKNIDNPDDYASLVWHTIKHELIHDAVSGHNESFTSAEAAVSRALGKMEIKALTRLRGTYADPNDSERVRADLDRPLQIYQESRGRQENSPDIFGGEASHTNVAGPEGKGAGGAGIQSSGKGTVSEWDDALFNREKPYEELERLNPKATVGDTNSAAIIDGDGKVHIGDYHDDLMEENGYANYHELFNAGGVRIRPAYGGINIEIGKINDEVLKRVRKTIASYPGQEFTVEFSPINFHLPTKSISGNADLVLRGLDRWQRVGEAAAKYASPSYWHQRRDDELFNREQTKKPEFKNWFGDWEDPNAFSSKREEGKPPVSMAVNKDGTPKVLYHSTSGDFNQFEVGRGSFNSNVLGSYETNRHGIFLAESPEFANEFVIDPESPNSKPKTGGKTIPVYLNIKSPLDLRSGKSTLDEDTLDDFKAHGVNPRWITNGTQHTWELFDDEDGKEFVRAAKEMGYDGAIITDDSQGDAKNTDTWVAFEPAQVKSAIGNSGSFDPNDPNILRNREKPQEENSYLTEDDLSGLEKAISDKKKEGIKSARSALRANGYKSLKVQVEKDGGIHVYADFVGSRDDAKENIEKIVERETGEKPKTINLSGGSFGDWPLKHEAPSAAGQESSLESNTSEIGDGGNSPEQPEGRADAPPAESTPVPVQGGTVIVGGPRQETVVPVKHDWVPREDTTNGGYRAPVGTKRIGREGYVDILTELPISSLVMPQGNNLYAQAIQKYQAAGDSDYPVVIPDERGNVVDDGNHRVEAARRAGKSSTMVWMRQPENSTERTKDLEQWYKDNPSGAVKVHTNLPHQTTTQVSVPLKTALDATPVVTRRVLSRKEIMAMAAGLAPKSQHGQVRSVRDLMKEAAQRNPTKIVP
jgi:hypothetical protein